MSQLSHMRLKYYNINTNFVWQNNNLIINTFNILNSNQIFSCYNTMILYEKRIYDYFHSKQKSYPEKEA